MKKQKIYFIASFILLIFSGVLLTLIILLANQPSKIDAANEKFLVTVPKVSTVTIYASGKDVKLKDENLNETIYEVSTNSDFDLICVNESRLMTSWKICDESGNKIQLSNENDRKITLSIDQNIIVETIRTDPTIYDTGRYMDNSFSISNETHLIYLDHIFAYENNENIEDSDVIEAYDYFFKNDPNYKVNVINQDNENEKITYIKNNNLFDLIQKGYYKIQESFTVLQESFKGIGSSQYPFNGVFCGLNDTNSSNAQIFMSLNVKEEETDAYYGLFEVCGENAIIRNLIVRNSIGVSKMANTNASLYVGGIAGKIDHSFLNNLTISSSINVDVYNKNIYAGGIAGIFEGGIDSYSNIFLEFGSKTWVLTSSENTQIYGGLVAGKAVNTYIKKLDVETSNLSMNVRNIKTISEYKAEIKNYIGNIFGYYENSEEEMIENINLHGSEPEFLHSTLSVGNNYVGGLIGYIKSTNTLTIGKINFSNTNQKQSEFISEAFDGNSRVNLYASGLIAYIEGETVVANNDFKYRLTEKNVDGKLIYENDYLYDMPLEVKALQQGIQDKDSSYGDTIASGLVAYGLIDINGIENDHSDLVLTSLNYQLIIKAELSSMTTHPLTNNTDYVGNQFDNNPKHCISSLVFGYLEKGTKFDTFENINVYADNFSVTATRNIGSRSLGDVNASGFLGYDLGYSANNICLYFGKNTSIKAQSLSYEVGYSGNTSSKNLTYNGNFVSAFISHLLGNNNEIKNIKVSGFDFIIQKEVGTSLNIEGIQNAKAYDNEGCSDYANENYVGGIFGCIRGNVKVSNCEFNGNENNDAEILMQGHRDPNSAFCGGIVGFAKLINPTEVTSANQTYVNCVLKNTKVFGSSTISNSTNYQNPDIYVGGIVGASFTDGNGGTINISNSYIFNSQIIGNGNERIEVYVAGIIGCNTWSGSANIKDCYVYKSLVLSSVDATTSIVKDTIGARAAGIMGSIVSCTVSFNNCAVIDSDVQASCSDKITHGKTNTKAAIVYCDNNNSVTIDNCYTNANLLSTYADSSSNIAIFSVTSQNSYYVKNRYESSITSEGIGLDFSDKEFNINEKKAILQFGSSSNENGSIKLYYHIIDQESFSSNWQAGKTEEVKITALKENIITKAEVWINVYEDGSNDSPYDFLTVEEKIEAGWFKLGEVSLICGTMSGDKSLSDFEQSYLVDDEEYVYDKTNKNFITKETPKKILTDLGYEELEEVVSNYTIYPTNVYLKSDLPYVKITFTAPSSTTYFPLWYQSQENAYKQIEMGDTQFVNYGQFLYSYQTVNEEKTQVKYEITYIPNKEYENNDILYLVFKVGNTDEYATTVIKFNIFANSYELVGGALAEYTPSVNIDNNRIGSQSNPYLFQVSTTYKIIPILKRKNEQDIEIIKETHIQDINYNLADQSSGKLQSNGELTTSSVVSDQIYSISLQLKGDTTEYKLVYFKIVNKYNVSYTSDGASIEGLPFATSTTDYYLEINISSHCGGVPEQCIILINGNEYNLVEEGEDDSIANIPENYRWLYDEKGNKLDNWYNSLAYYQLRIPSNYIVGDISITLSFIVNYKIEFKIQNSVFNQDFENNYETSLSVNVKGGTKFQDLFNRTIVLSNNTNYIGKKYIEVLNEWTEKASEISFGFLFTGFYLIDDSSSIASYGQSFEQILNQNIIINTSYTFYARWSFLVELVEAPGTHIVASFNQDFMYDVSQAEYPNLLNHDLTIPINNNRGYVFTIVKDDNFIGEAYLEAYIITNNKNQHKISKINIEKYHDNMYLYYIPKEVIQGYLVIATKVSNYDLIIGEDTSSVTTNVLPEDGIFNFKYIVNHKYNESYLYNGDSDNLKLNRNILIEFFENVYNKESQTTTMEAKNLPLGTVIEVYYHQYLNGNSNPVKTIIGRYEVKDSVSKIHLLDFNNFNNSEKAFESKTFEEIFGQDNDITEEYYFVVVPPNGYRSDESQITSKGIYGNYITNYIRVGYCNEKDEYLVGKKLNEDFTNIPIEEELKANLRYESAEQIGVYQLIPSRYTSLKNNDNGFTFIDQTSFHIFDCLVENGELSNNNHLIFKSKLEEQTTNLTSTQIKQGIKKLVLNIGYNKGQMKVIPSNDGITFDENLAITIDVDTELYKDYVIEFDVSKYYQYFRLVNSTNSEIRLANISIITIENEIEQTLYFSNISFDDLYLPNYTVTNIPLPSNENIIWTLETSTTDKIENNYLIIDQQDETKTITVVAKMTEYDRIKTKKFNITIPGKYNENLTLDDLYIPSVTNTNFYLPKEINGQTITWKLVNENETPWMYPIATFDEDTYEVTVSRPYFGNYNNTATLTATFTDPITNSEKTKEFTVKLLNDGNSASEDEITLPTNVYDDFYLPTSNDITWKLNDSNYAKLVDNKVIVTRGTSDETITLIMTKESNTKEYNIIIKKLSTKISLDDLILPSTTSSNIMLPNFKDLIWTVLSGDVTYDDQSKILTLNGDHQDVQLKAQYRNEEKNFTIYMQSLNLNYSLKEEIIGDYRHEGKQFILACQFKDQNGDIIQDIQNVTLSVNGKTYYPIITSDSENDVKNRNVLYFALTNILAETGGTTINIIINHNNNVELYVVQLLECSLLQKPAYGEVRENYKIED